ASELLRLGQVLAWRCGLAHFREGALEAAKVLPTRLAMVAVGALANSEWPAVQARLLKEPWFDPSHAWSPGILRVAKKVGTFRGFGGHFLELPEVASLGGQFVVRSGSEAWWLLADAFGATLHRATPADLAAASAGEPVPGLAVSRGKI